MTDAIAPACSALIGTGFKPVFIAKRQMVQQVFNRLDAAFGQLGGNALAHPLYKLDRCRKFQHTPMLSTSNPMTKPC